MNRLRAPVRVLHARVPAADALARAIASPDWPSRIIKPGERAWVIEGLATVGATPTEVVVKCVRLDRPKDRLAAALGRTRLLRQWRGAILLERAGIDTAPPLLIARARDGHSAVELLVTPRLPGRTLTAHAAGSDLSPAHRHRLAGRVGAQAAAIALAAPPLFNRDHKGSNIIVVPTPDGPVPVIIDTPGVRRWRPGDAPIAMLAKLYIEMLGVARVPARTDRWRTLRAFYRHYLEDWTAADTPTRRAQVKKGWRAIERIVQRHGDPTPKDNVDRWQRPTPQTEQSGGE